jgi:hypothetical protein
MIRIQADKVDLHIGAKTEREITVLKGGEVEAESKTIDLDAITKNNKIRVSHGHQRVETSDPPSQRLNLN